MFAFDPLRTSARSAILSHRRGNSGTGSVNLSLFEKIWLAAACAFIAYPVGDILGYWDIKATIVMVCAGLLVATGWKVGRQKDDRRS